MYKLKKKNSRQNIFRNKTVSFGWISNKLWVYHCRHEGIQGFYRGLSPYLIHVTPNICIVFLTFEYVTGWAEAKRKEALQKPLPPVPGAIPIEPENLPKMHAFPVLKTPDQIEESAETKTDLSKSSTSRWWLLCVGAGSQKV